MSSAIAHFFPLFFFISASSALAATAIAATTFFTAASLGAAVATFSIATAAAVGFGAATIYLSSMANRGAQVVLKNVKEIGKGLKQLVTNIYRGGNRAAEKLLRKMTDAPHSLKALALGEGAAALTIAAGFLTYKSALASGGAFAAANAATGSGLFTVMVATLSVSAFMLSTICLGAATIFFTGMAVHSLKAPFTKETSFQDIAPPENMQPSALDKTENLKQTFDATVSPKNSATPAVKHEPGPAPK